MEGQEGAIHIDALDGRVLTAPDDRPEWADGYAVALLGERIGWYEARLGQQLPESIRKPEILVAQDLGWIGMDAEADEVEIEADTDHRMTTLANLLNIDREDFDQERNFQNVLAQADIDHTYSTHPTTEATLEEVEGASFADVEKKAVHG
jgi:phage gp46-like protein